MRHGFLLGPALLLVACSSPAPEAAAPEPTAAPIEVADDSGDELARRLSAAARDIEDLKAQVADQEEELQTAYSDVERWKSGLDKCVNKLNEVSADTSAIAAASYAPPVASGARGGAARVSTLSAPWASVVGDSAVVSVRLWNGGDADASGSGSVCF